MNMDLQGRQWASLKEKKVGMEKVNIEDLKILIKALQLCTVYSKSKVNRIRKIRAN